MSSYEFSPFSAAMCEQKVGMFFFGDDHVFFSPEDFGSTICLVLFQAFSKKIWALPKGSGIQRWEKENHQPRQ